MFASAYVGRKRRAKPFDRFYIKDVKAFEKYHIRPTFADANMGHPDRFVGVSGTPAMADRRDPPVTHR